MSRLKYLAEVEHVPLFHHERQQHYGVGFRYADYRSDYSFAFLFDQSRPMQGRPNSVVIDYGVPFIQSIEYAPWGSWTGGRPKRFELVVDTRLPKPWFGDYPQGLREVPDDRDFYEIMFFFTNGSTEVFERQCTRDYAHRLTVALNQALSTARDLMGQRKAPEPRPMPSIQSPAPVPLRRVID